MAAIVARSNAGLNRLIRRLTRSSHGLSMQARASLFFQRESSTKTSKKEEEEKEPPPKYKKETTGLVGLEVEPFGRDILTRLYEKTLTELETIPKGVAYRERLEIRTKFRLQILKENEDVFEIEKKN